MIIISYLSDLYSYYNDDDDVDDDDDNDDDKDDDKGGDNDSVDLFSITSWYVLRPMEPTTSRCAFSARTGIVALCNESLLLLIICVNHSKCTCSNIHNAPNHDFEYNIHNLPNP